MLNIITHCLYTFLIRPNIFVEYTKGINTSKHSYLRRTPAPRNTVPIMVPELEEPVNTFNNDFPWNGRSNNIVLDRLNLTDIELEDLKNMYKNEKDMIEREDKVEVEIPDKHKKFPEEPPTRQKNINEFDEFDASNLQAAVNNPNLTLEELHEQIKALRASSPELIKRVEEEALDRFYILNPDGEPAESLLAAHHAVENAERELKLREQEIIHQMDAIRDSIRIAEGSHEAGKIFAKQNPQAKESELLKHQYLVAQEIQQQINEERDKQAVIESEGQKAFNKALEQGALQSDAVKEAELEKQKVQNELGVTNVSMNMITQPIKSDLFDDFASQEANDFESKKILNDQMFIEPCLPIPSKEEIDQLARRKMEEAKEAEDLLNSFITEQVNRKGFPLKDFLEDAFTAKKQGLDPWETVEKYLTPFPNDNIRDAFTGIKNSFPDYGNQLLNRGIANANPNSELLQTLAQQNIGQQFGLTENEKNSLLKQGRLPEEIEEINNEIITENRLTNNELLNSYDKNIQSGNLYDDLVNRRMEILQRINKNPSTASIDDRIKRNELLKQRLGMEPLPVLSLPAQEKGDRVYEEVLQQTGDPDFAKEMAQKSAMAYENRMNEERTFLDSKKASADIFEATNVIEEAKDFVTKEDAKTIKEAQRVKHLEPGLLDAEKAKRETESAEAIQREIEKLRVLEMEHKVQAEELAIQSNLKAKKAQQLEELSHATDILQTEEILGQEREERIKNLGIKKIIEDDETELTFKNASMNFPLKTFGEVEATDEEEYKIMQSQEGLKEDLKNTVTETHFDSRLNVIKTDEGFLNIGENATEVEIFSGEVIFPFSALQEMKKRGLKTDMLEKKTNKGEQRNMATGIVYYSAPIAGGKFPLPRPLNPTPSHIITTASGEKIDTLFAQSMSVFEGRLNLEPMTTYKNYVRPRVNKPLNVEKALSVEQQVALEQLKQRADEIEQTQVQVFENPDGTRVVKLIKPFGEASTMSTEKAIEKDEGIHVQRDFISFNVADLENGAKISDDLTLQVFSEALAEGRIEDPNFVSQFLKEHGGNQELISQLEEKAGFEGMEQVIETKGEGATEALETAQAQAQTQTQAQAQTQTQAQAQTQTQTQAQGGKAQAQAQAQAQGQSEEKKAQAQAQGGQTQAQAQGQSEEKKAQAETQTQGGQTQIQGGQTQGGQIQSQGAHKNEITSTEVFGGTKVNKTTTPPQSNPSGGTKSGQNGTTTTTTTTSTVTYGNTPPRKPTTPPKPTQPPQRIQVEQTEKPNENTEIKRKVIFDNNAKIGDVAQKFDPTHGLPGLSKPASDAFKELNEHASELEKAYNLDKGTIKNVVNKLPLKVFQEFEENMNNYGQGDDTLHLKDPNLPVNHPLNNPNDPRNPEYDKNKSKLKNPNLPPNHPENLINTPNRHRDSLETIDALDGGINTSRIEDLLYDMLSKYNKKPNPKKITAPTGPQIIGIKDLGNGRLQVSMKERKSNPGRIDPKIGQNVGRKSTDKDGNPCIYDLSGTCVPTSDYNNQNIIKHDKFFGSEEDKKKMENDLKEQNPGENMKPNTIVIKGPVEIKQNPPIPNK